MTEVEKLCDVVGIIHNGKLLAEGTPAQLRDTWRENDLEEIFVKIVSPHVTAEVS
jgi:sodium transport system ATP-binding protein